MYICQHPENTRVGANCNSPFHMGEFVIWAKYNVGELQFAHPLRAIRPLLYVSNSLSKPSKKIFLKTKSEELP